MTGDRKPFQYAALRIVPRVERGEAVNAGVVLFCRPLRFLGARTQLDETLLRAICEHDHQMRHDQSVAVLQFCRWMTVDLRGRSRSTVVIRISRRHGRPIVHRLHPCTRA